MKKKLGSLLLLCVLLLCAVPAREARAADLPYYVTVNLTENIVTVYGRDASGAYTVPEKAFVCSAGWGTPEGTFRTSDKYTWRILFGNVYGQYATRITGHILFHSVPYLEQDKSTLEYEEYNKLGETASAGCIRLTAADAKWLYDNCPSGTTVRMYRGNVSEPLQPDAPQKIDTSNTALRGWDPTDPDPQNPWAKLVPKAREIALRTDKSTRTMDAYYEAGYYYLTAKDCKQLFARLGITLILPEAAGEETDTVKIWYRAAQHSLTRYQKDGQAYYRLRDLAGLTGVSLSWETAEQEISLRYGKEELSLFQAE